MVPKGRYGISIFMPEPAGKYNPLSRSWRVLNNTGQVHCLSSYARNRSLQPCLGRLLRVILVHPGTALAAFNGRSFNLQRQVISKGDETRLAGFVTSP